MALLNPLFTNRRTTMTMILFQAVAVPSLFIHIASSFSFLPTSTITARIGTGTATATIATTKIHQQLNNHNHHPLFHSKPSALFSSNQNYNQDNDGLSPGIAIIQQHNPTLHSALSNLRSLPYFRYYSVDMLASCEYIPQELFECYSQTCEIYPVDEYDEDTGNPVVPDSIRTLDVQEFDFDIDGWARWDMPSEDYYDIIQFNEEFTNYDGSEVWKFIHSKIAFPEVDQDDTQAESWKRDFNKAVSGMHSMISAHIIEGIQTKIDNGEEFDQGCTWTDPKVEYARRLGPNGNTPNAIRNMYFTYMLLLSAVHSVREYILTKNNFGCDDDDTECDIQVHEALENVLSSPLLSTNNDDLNVAYNNLHEHALKDEQSKHNLWEARMRSRELLRIMNCVQCNKCRLHGKIAAMGLSTALQLILGKSGNGLEMSNPQDFQKIHRVELAALMTTLAKFSNAINYCMEMEQQI